jgi:P-type Cu+ transporter
MRVLPWLYEIPANELRWFLLAMTAAVVAWAGRGIYVSAIARCVMAQRT